MNGHYLKYWPLFLIIFFLIAQLPFISADPDHLITWSSGPATDEGLNTIQVRNFINHSYISMWECDNLIKTPLLAVFLSIAYFIFGTSLEVGRLLILILGLVLVFVIFKRKNLRLLLIPLTTITFTNFYIFHFFHFSMAEILATIFTLFAIYLYALYHNNKNFTTLFLSIFFFSAAYYLKIQFLYIIFIVPALLLIDFVSKNIGFKTVARAIAILLGFLFLYYLIWFLPNNDVFVFMLKGQSGGIEIFEETPKVIEHNFSYYFMGPFLKYNTYVFFLLLIIGFIMLHKTEDKWYKYLFLGSFLWVFVEIHKLTFTYSPSRYFISAIFSMLCLNSIVVWKMMCSGKSIILPISGVILILALFSLNIMDYISSLNKRTFYIAETNEKISEKYSSESLFVGAWASSFNYSSKSRAFPIFLNFLNNNEPLKTYEPDMVIIGKEEVEPYLKSGIPIKEYASLYDSTLISGYRWIYFFTKRNE